ncbi:hypothetical protein DRQ50_04790 [bacterium]|nr:MAG: hypothetical protein DRQ50_04790 [bacterium]
MDWEFFTISGDHYLAIANYYNGTTLNLNSVIYKWNTGTLQFDSFQSIATNGAFDWHFFTIETDHYLAIANFHNGSTHNADSKIYKWNTNTLQFDANFTGTIGYADKTINKGLRLFDVRSNETSISISQKIEEIEKITDNSLTLSFTASSTKSTEVITSIVINGIIYSQTDSVSSEEKQIKFTAGISDTITSLSILISMKNDGTNELFLSEAKLEEGSIASGFERNSIAKELIICRRYARLSDVNVRAAEFTYEMYAAPTVTALGIGFLYEANL